MGSEMCIRDRHQKETSRNCTIVKVTGLGNAVKIAFEDVLVKIDVEYQNVHSMINLQLTGAFKLSAISCPVSLMLILRVRTVLIASVRLFCLPCLPLCAEPLAQEFQLAAFDARLAGHRSLECRP